MDAIDLVYERGDFTPDEIVLMCIRHNIHRETVHHGHRDIYSVVTAVIAIIKRFSRGMEGEGTNIFLKMLNFLVRGLYDRRNRFEF